MSSSYRSQESEGAVNSSEAVEQSEISDMSVWRGVQTVAASLRPLAQWTGWTRTMTSSEPQQASGRWSSWEEVQADPRCSEQSCAGASGRAYSQWHNSVNGRQSDFQANQIKTFNCEDETRQTGKPLHMVLLWKCCKSLALSTSRNRF